MTLQETLYLLENHSWKKESLTEISSYLKDVITILDGVGLRHERLECLLLIFYFRETEYSNHWKNKLDGFIPNVPLIKKKNGKDVRPKKELIYNHLWKKYDDIDYSTCLYKGIFENAFFDEEYKRKTKESFGIKGLRLPWEQVRQNQDIQGIHDFTDDFHLWTSEILSKNGTIARQEVYNKIDELLEKYRYKL
ncbi:hypothetical protein [Treponema primitia]|uniref:hypothetical protein n=1 Tax=Treponema primitia TaxID=88058 RepID=UPI0002F62829|nr:hypothetical protein [Treponema primitia]